MIFAKGNTFLTSIIADYEFFEPQTPGQQFARDRLLIECLRPDKPAHYQIAEEYPLVLGPEGSRHSICVALKGHDPGTSAFLAHANLWFRTMACGTELAAGSSTVKLGLVGNVATNPREQGKGWMRTLLGEIERRALSQGADAIVLWSDLESFYQKLGFEPAGTEIRMTLSTKKLRRYSQANLKENLDKAVGVKVWLPDGYRTGELPEALIERMLHLRSTGFNQPFFQLERSPQEFSELLKIPDLSLFVGHGENSGGLPTIDFFFIVGKGMDMQGIIHEWGTTDMNLLIGGAAIVAKHVGLDELTILVPPAIISERLTELRRVCTRSEHHPMAWVKTLNPKTKPLVEQALHKGFIWGLDSI